MSVDFAFITYRDLPNLDADDRLVTKRLTDLGCRCASVVWSDTSFDWTTSAIGIIRSTWDYHLHHHAFARWVQEIDSKTRLFNEVSLVLWNMDKTYMQDLQNQGIPIVPTIFSKAGQGKEFAALIESTDWSEIILKPTIGLCTHGVRKFSRDTDSAAAEKHYQMLLGDGHVMIQPYMHSVETYGERSLVFIDGRFTHAVRRIAFQPLALAGQAGEYAVEATRRELDLGYNVLACLAAPPLYARVDMVDDADNQPCVIELELIEPSLFLSASELCVQRLTEALLKRR